MRPMKGQSSALEEIYGRDDIDRLVNNAGRAVTWSGKTFRLVQTGNTGFYIFAMVISIILLLVAQVFV